MPVIRPFIRHAIYVHWYTEKYGEIIKRQALLEPNFQLQVEKGKFVNDNQLSEMIQQTKALSVNFANLYSWLSIKILVSFCIINMNSLGKLNNGYQLYFFLSYGGRNKIKWKQKLICFEAPSQVWVIQWSVYLLIHSWIWL